MVEIKRRRNVIIIILVALMLVASSLAVYVIYLRPQPIAISSVKIDGNEDLTKDNGVTSGNGTADNPFVIEGLVMRLSEGISITNTDAYLVIRGVILYNTTVLMPAIDVANVENLSLINVWISEAWEGVRVRDSRNCEMRGCQVSLVRAGSGLTLERCINFTAQGNVIRSSGWSLTGAIEVVESQACVFANNTISETSAGIHVLDSEGCEFDSNDVNTTGWGMNLESSQDITLKANSFARMGIQLKGDSVDDYSTHTITVDNMLGGKPIMYRNNEHGVTVSDAILGEIIIANCSSVHIANVQILDTSGGVFVCHSSDTSIENVIVSGRGIDYLASFLYGIEVEFCSRVSLVSNSVLDMGGGIRCQGTDVTVSRNYLSVEVYCTSLGLSGATISNNTFDGQEGIMLISGSNVLILNNTFFNCSGISIDLGTVSDVLVTGNSLIRSNIIARMSSVRNVLFHHNEFMNCSRGAIFDGYVNCSWDSGYPGGGNYWSNYTGLDVFSGPGQDVLGSDGIGDTPYAVSEALEIWDNYPLMSPVSA